MIFGREPICLSNRRGRIMELRHLRYFVAVAEELNFRRAAERLRVSQPPLSLQIKDLERELGAELFDRSQQKVALTQPGRIFLAHAKQALQQIELAKMDVRRAVGGEAGELKIGFTHSSAFVAYLPETVRTFRARYPHVTLTLREMRSSEQVEAIVERKLDFGLMRKPKRRLPATVAMEKLCEDALILALPESDPLAHGETVLMSDLADHQFICVPHDDGTGLYDAVIELCGSAGFRPKIEQTVRGVQTLIGLVAAGLGVSVVPSSLASISRAGVAYRTIADAAARSDLYIVSSAFEHSRLGTEFKDMLRTSIATARHALPAITNAPRARGAARARNGRGKSAS
jgi:DNA-binding transcriptional LysR family regulator